MVKLGAVRPRLNENLDENINSPAAPVLDKSHSFPQRLSTLVNVPAIVASLTLFSVHRLKADSVTLAWDANPETEAVEGYKIYSGKKAGRYTKIIDVGNVTEFTVNALLPDVTYNFVVSAYNRNGEGPPSNEIFVIANAPWPPVPSNGKTEENLLARAAQLPSNIKATSTAAGVITVNWTNPDTSSTSSLTSSTAIYYGENFGEPTRRIVVPGSGNTITISGLEPGRKYYVTMKAIGDDGHESERTPVIPIITAQSGILRKTNEAVDSSTAEVSNFRLPDAPPTALPKCEIAYSPERADAASLTISGQPGQMVWVSAADTPAGPFTVLFAAALPSNGQIVVRDPDSQTLAKQFYRVAADAP